MPKVRVVCSLLMRSQGGKGGLVFPLVGKTFMLLSYS